MISTQTPLSDTVFSYPQYGAVEAEIRDYLDSPDHRLYWCSKCDVPLLTPTCYQCHSHGRRFIVDAKPVFGQERRTLEELCGRRLPDHLYISRGRLYYKGRFFMALAVRDGNVLVTKDLSESLFGKAALNSSDSTSLEVAIAANMPALRFLEQQSMEFIQESARQYPHRKLVVSFSGGKDSAVVAHLVARTVGTTRPLSLFFADTTLEHPETGNYVQQFAEYYGLPIAVERATADFFQMCEQLEPPSRIMRWCCTIFKANPLNAYLNGNHDILCFDGIRRAESNRRRHYQRVSGNKKALSQLVCRPILDWSSLAVWLYIFAYQVPYNPAYDKGYARVGCVICPYSTDFDDVLTRRNYPERVERWESLLERYFHQDYSDRFAPEHCTTWLRQGLWKKRKPHHDNQLAVTRVATCPSLNEYAYQLDFCIDVGFVEYLKPLGNLVFVDETGFFKVANEGRFNISGKVGEDLLTVSFEGTDVRRNLQLLERQVKKAMNCVKCGACVSMCPHYAIEVVAGSSFTVDAGKCTNCLACVRSDFTNYGCIALSYKRERNWIEEE
jgi:phosphoadenosine phosphosulfate reductase